jgi:methyltransferase (TIGR00027 family)
MAHAAGKTGSGPTVIVAVEQHTPLNQRIIADDLAPRILPFGARAFVSMMRFDFARNWIIRASEKSFPGIWGGVLCRKRYIDEKLIESSGQIDAVINLGAGLDTRAYRLSPLSHVPVWELDQPENIEPKRAALRTLFRTVPKHVALVSIDFDRQELAPVLKSHGFSLEKRTFFIWEAVTQYLTESGIRATFGFLANAARGSRLVFTYVRKEFLGDQDIYGQQELHKRYVVNKKIWLFGLEPEGVASFLEAYGWRVAEHLGYEELDNRYVRPTGRRLAVTPIERIVYAEKL